MNYDTTTFKKRTLPEVFHDHKKAHIGSSYILVILAKMDNTLDKFEVMCSSFPLLLWRGEIF